MIIKGTLSEMFKFLAMILIVTVLVCSVFPQQANASVMNTFNNDIYEQRFKENITFENVTYTLNYSYDENRNRTITIYDPTNNSTDVVKYVEKDETAYLNNKEFAKFDFQNEKKLENAVPYASWRHLGDDTVTVEWDDAATAVAIAAAIAAAVGICALVAPAAVTAGAVLSAIGPTIVAGWVGISVGGTADMSFYQMVEFGTVQYRMEWSMKVNGKTYSCTPIGWVANPYMSNNIVTAM